MIGSLALCSDSTVLPVSIPKTSIIDAVGLSHTIGGASTLIIAYWRVRLLPPLYTFRALFMTFHGPEHTDAQTRDHIHEPSWVVWLPLVLLAIPSARDCR